MRTVSEFILSMTHRILLADSHPVVHQGIRSSFQKSADFEIVAEVTKLEQFNDSVQKHRPNILITDVRLGGKDALNALDKVMPEQEGMVVIIFSHHEDTFSLARAGALGCYEYVSKSNSCSDLVEAVRNAVDGVVQSPDSLLNKTRSRMKSKQPNLDGQTPLTEREMQVIRHISMGLKNREIAKSLEISVETVKEHVQNILRKLSVSDRTQAAVTALKNRWV